MSDTPQPMPVGPDQVREWARKRGHEVGARGPISPQLAAKFNKAHKRFQYAG